MLLKHLSSRSSKRKNETNFQKKKKKEYIGFYAIISICNIISLHLLWTGNNYDSGIHIYEKKLSI